MRWHRKVTWTTKSHHQGWFSPNYRSCQKTRHQSFYGHLALAANWKVEKLNKWVTHELVPKSKKSSLWSLLLLYTTMSHFLIRLWCATRNGFYMTTNDDQCSVWTKKKLQSTCQSQTCTKKKSFWSLFGGLLPVWFTTAFCFPAKPLHLRSMLSKSMRCTKNWNACSQNWSTERAQFFSATMPNCTLQNQHFKSSINWATNFGLICRIHLTSQQLTTTSSSILTTFFRENASTYSRRQKMLFQEFVKSWSIDFYTTGINQFISRWQKCVDCNGSILINKDVFESSYNDLKFMIPNCNYVCTNLIQWCQGHILRSSDSVGLGWGLGIKVFKSTCDIMIYNMIWSLSHSWHRAPRTLGMS